MSKSQLPAELQRAEVLADKLAKSIAIARATYQRRVSLPLEEAEELVQLLEDSLKTAKRMLGQGRALVPRRSG